MKNTLEQLSGEFSKILGGLELNGGCNFMDKNGIEASQCKYDYKYDYTMWQYTSSGYVSGINTKVDLNIGYKRY